MSSGIVKPGWKEVAFDVGKLPIELFLQVMESDSFFEHLFEVFVKEENLFFLHRIKDGSDHVSKVH